MTMTKPRPLKNKASDRLRPQAAVLYPALKQAGPVGLSWIECFALLGADTQPGAVVVWMRAHGVGVLCLYDDAGSGYETRFALSGT
jgi:hypothetical protein